MATDQDIAERAQVSISTVSRVLNLAMKTLSVNAGDEKREYLRSQRNWNTE